MAGLLQHRLQGACLFAPSTLPRQRPRCTCAAAAEDAEDAETAKRSKLPSKGFFAEADTNAPVYSPLGRVAQTGRYSPEFLWNTNWQEQLELEEAVERQQLEAAAASPPDTAGGLSLRRVADLDSMDVDLTEQLLRRSSDALGAAPAASTDQQRAPWQGRGGQSADGAAQRQRGPSRTSFPKMPPRRGEAARWERSEKFVRRGVQAPATPAEAAEAAATLAAEREAYARYKQQLMGSTAALGVALTVAGFGFYSKDVGASYAVGAVASVVYLNMLNRSIDGVGGSGGAAGAAASQPRLLIPIILAMAYNRWNTLAADSAGVTLQLMPMLLGFLTYKAAVIARGAADLFGDLAGQERPTSDFTAQAVSDAGADSKPPSADEVVIGRDYANRILQG